MSFQIATLENYCPEIAYNFKTKNLKDTHLVDVLIISFHGKYRDGSSGRADAGLIKGITKLGVSVFDPFGLIIDLSNLEYNWGDNFDITFEDAEPKNSVVLVGEKCRKAMSTLAYGIDTNKDIVDNIFFFDDLDTALNHLKDKS